MKNAYPELPELPYKKTSIAESEVIAFLDTFPIHIEVKRAAFVLFANESGHGKKGVNNNYMNIQADGARIAKRWDSFIEGTCIVTEHLTGHKRRFICFNTWKASVNFAVQSIISRGMYIGGLSHPYARNMAVKDETDLARSFHKEWVEGDNSEPGQTYIDDIVSLYAAAKKYFR